MAVCSNCGTTVPASASFCGACGQKVTGQVERAVGGLVGMTIAGRYRVLRVIAEGGMGIVYEAEQTMGEGARRVAVKTLLPELSRDPIVVSRFSRECSVVAGLEHPNTVRVYDFGAIDDGTLYIAMEFVKGRPLGDVIAEGMMPLSRCLRITEQIASALEEAHGQGIVHRDLKPDNLILCDRAGIHDFVKVLDFGIAKRSSVGGRHDTKLTQQGMVLGTPPYMSPEQFSGEVLDRSSDVYSLGVIVYEMLNGKLPFEGDTPWQWAHQHMSVEPAAFVAQVSAEVQGVVLSSLAKSRSGRPASAVEFHCRLLAASGLTSGAMSRLGGLVMAHPFPQGVAKGDTSADQAALQIEAGASGPVLGPSLERGVERTEPSTLGLPPSSERRAVHTEPSIAAIGSPPREFGARTEPSLASSMGAPGSVGCSPTANPGSLLGSRAFTGTTNPVPGAEVTEIGMHRIAAARAAERGSEEVGQSASRAVVGARRRRTGTWIVASLLLVLALGLGAGFLWWQVLQRDDGAAPLPTPSAVAPPAAATIFAEPHQIPTPTKPASGSNLQSAFNRPIGTPASQPPSMASGTANSPQWPMPVVSAQPTPPTVTNPFPLPFPIALPSSLPQLTLPPLATPTPMPPTNPASPAPTQPSVATPASTQSCTNAVALASTDLAASVTQYQACETAIGRTAAAPTRAVILKAGTEQARALAVQGRCEEAIRIVQILARISAERPAKNAVSQAGCRI